MLQALSFPLHLAAICLIALAVLQLSTGTHRKSDVVIPTEPTLAGSSCIRVRQEIQVSYPGCVPTTTKMPFCTGRCESYSVISNPNHVVTRCLACSAVEYRIKKRRVGLTCNGTQTSTTIFYPFITACACTNVRPQTPTGTDPPIPLLNTTVTPPSSPPTGTQDTPIPLLNITVATLTNSSVLPCQRSYRKIAVESEGCQPAITKVPVCSGFCFSYSVTSFSVPYITSECTYCTATRHQVKKRSLDFSCNGTTEVKTVFIPIIQECSCSHAW